MIKAVVRTKSLVIIFTIFFVFFTATIIAWLVTSDVAENELHSMFDQQSDTIALTIENRFNLYTTIAYGIVGFIRNNDSVTMGNWYEYLGELKLNERFPGINSIAYAEVVRRENLQSFLDEIRSDNTFEKSYPDFNIYPEEDKEVYYVVKYVRPIERDSALGFDMSSSPVRLDAFNRSVENEHIALTDRVMLVADGEEGYIMVAPVIVDETLEGFVVITYKSQLSFKSLYDKVDPFPDLKIKLYRGTDRKDEALLYEHSQTSLDSEKNYKPRFTRSDTIRINGEVLALDITTKPGFLLSPTAERLPMVVLVSGLVSSFIFLGIFISKLRNFSSEYSKQNNRLG